MEQGVVKFFSEVKGYGFIVSDVHDQDIFVHYSDIRGVGYKNLVSGERVEFIVITDDQRRLIAKDVVSIAGG